MIPKIIHYCWFGHGEMPQLALDCIASWHEYMPDWEYKLWNENNFDINSVPYVKDAYEAGKYAFVSDVVRLHALKEFGGVYMDTDVMALKSLEPLLDNSAFAGFEGSKRCPVGTSILASESGGDWICRQMGYYEGRDFIKADGSLDLTTNVEFLTGKMISEGLVCDGNEKYFKGLHIYPVDFFSPRLTTGEYVKTENTYCDHLGMNSWGDNKQKPFLLRLAGPELSVKLIKLKRRIFG